MRSRAALGFGAGAAILLAAFAICHALGFRDDVSVISGTVTSKSTGDATTGVIYVVSWLLAVVVAPILALAAALQMALSRYLGRAPQEVTGEAPPSEDH
jgi:hypothetical protein